MAYGTVNADVIGTSVAGSNLGAGNASIMKNRIINGAMVIDQRNAGASTTPTTTGATVYNLDRWAAVISQASKLSFQQNAGSVTPPAGFSNYLGITSLAATSLGATDYFFLQQRIEGYNIADLNWGSANAKTVTLSFWVRSSLTGNFGGCLSNGAENRFYAFSYSIPSANTWTQISITIAGDTVGYFPTNNGNGMEVTFSLGTGSTYSGSAGSWGSSYNYSPSGSTSVVGTNGATFYITGVQLEVGSSATGYEYRQYGQELALCQRYYFRASPIGNTAQNQSFLTGVIASSTVGSICSTVFPVTMRSAPTSSFNDLRIYDGSTAPTLTSITITGSSYSYGSLSVAASSGSFTVGRAALVIPNSASSYIDFSAEL